MKILIDIGHPAHVHYFKNFIRIMKSKGHNFLIIARDKEITFDLLVKYNIPYISRGKGGKSLFSKVIYIPKADLIIYKEARLFKPDIFLSFGSTYAAHASKLYGKPHIALDDTEHAKFELLMYPPFTDVLLNPKCFKKNLGKKQIFFDSYIELSYLHPSLFEVNKGVRKILNLAKSDKFVLFRFISWGASHDIGQSGIPNDTKLELIKLFEKMGYIIFISAEGSLSDDFEKYRISISPELIHSILKEADIFIGESGTMATEAAILGTPSVFVNSLDAGVFQDEVKYGILYSYRNANNLVDKIVSLLKIDNLKEQHIFKSKKLLNNKINVTDFLVWFVENYPKSVTIMKENPDYQYNFN